jgi:hypothetical protein
MLRRGDNPDIRDSASLGKLNNLVGVRDIIFSQHDPDRSIYQKAYPFDCVNGSCPFIRLTTIQ